MFGEDRRGDNRVSCYRSADLVNWEFRNIVLSLNSPTHHHYVRTDLQLSPKNAGPFGIPATGPKGANIERPKVLYCENTGKFVMWMHYENGRDYNAARCAVAVCDTVDGDYVYMGSFNPVGNISRDCTLFKDDDGTAYFISSARDNADMAVYRLSEDYLTVDEQVKTLWPGQYREAPVLFKRDGLYYMLTSRCTGWNPNQGGYATAESIEGRWSAIRPFGNETTFNTQPTAAVKVGETYLYIGDRWDPSDYQNSTIVYLPMSFDNGCSIEWADEVTIENDNVTVSSREINDFRIMLWNCNDYVGGDGYNVFSKHLGYEDNELLWTMEEKDGFFMLRHEESGKYLSGDGILSEYREGEKRLLWKFADAEEGKLLINGYSGKSLLVFGRRVILSDRDDKHFGGFVFVKNY
ncbi:MAG: family 43 glycosylhydrolase, partial [Clostridia bacterium]